MRERPSGNVASRLQLRGDELLQLHDVRGEGADTLRGFLRGHGVFVQLVTEGLLIERDLLQVERLRGEASS